jgi:hypothetical protein
MDEEKYMNSRIKLLLGLLVFAAVLFFVVGPRLLTWMINNAPRPTPLKTAPIRIKASGTISLIGEHTLVLTTPHGTNNYVLVGSRESELKQFAYSKQQVFVFGALMLPSPRKINNTVIRYWIDVAEFDTKDFEIGHQISAQVAASIKQKVAEKIAFRDATMKKLGINNSRLDVISGTLVVIPGVIYSDPKEQTGLMVTDKYGDNYLLYDSGGIGKHYDDYNKFFKKDMAVVVVGQVSLPNPTIILPGKTEYIPFAAKKIFNSDLSEFVVERQKSKE